MFSSMVVVDCTSIDRQAWGVCTEVAEGETWGLYGGLVRPSEKIGMGDAV